jgi:hypothetical protein
MKFWQNSITGPWNLKFIKDAPPRRPIKDTFYYKDLINPMSYMPVYLTDLAAVRAQLDLKNDAGDVNTSSIYLVGAEGAAAIGMSWMAAEWNRPQFAPTPNQLGMDPRYEYVPQRLRGDFESAGNDISGAVWLSGSRPMSFSKAVVNGAISGILPNGSRMTVTPKIRDNNPMLFLYAAGDKKGENEAKYFHLEALVGKGDAKNGLRALNPNYLKPIAKGGTLSGVGLLGDNEKLGTETDILKFLDAQQQERKAIVRKNRDYKTLYYIKLNDFGLFPMANP